LHPPFPETLYQTALQPQSEGSRPGRRVNNSPKRLVNRGFQPFFHSWFFLKKYFVAIKNLLYLLHYKIFKKLIMNKAELIAKIADDAGITKTQANASVDSFVEAVTKTLKSGNKVTLVGFGTFSVSKRAARNGRNPQTGAVIKIKAKKVAKFKAGKELSAKI
jgi:DNA-binding protein HU-beta